MKNAETREIGSGNPGNGGHGKSGTARPSSAEDSRSSGLFIKEDHKRQFSYEVHTVCDANGFVLEAVVTPGNVHDKRPVYERLYRSG